MWSFFPDTQFRIYFRWFVSIRELHLTVAFADRWRQQCANKIVSAFALTQTNQYTWVQFSNTDTCTHPYNVCPTVKARPMLPCIQQFLLPKYVIYMVSWERKKGAKYTDTLQCTKFIGKVCARAAPYKFFFHLTRILDSCDVSTIENIKI